MRNLFSRFPIDQTRSRVATTRQGRHLFRIRRFSEILRHSRHDRDAETHLDFLSSHPARTALPPPSSSLLKARLTPDRVLSFTAAMAATQSTQQLAANDVADITTILDFWFGRQKDHYTLNAKVWFFAGPQQDAKMKELFEPVRSPTRICARN